MLTVPKYYHVYSPKKGHLYYETPVEGAKLEINYSAIIPKLVSTILISTTLILLLSKFKPYRFSKQKEFIGIMLSISIIVILSIAHFGRFGSRDLYLLGNVYVAMVSSISVLWMLYLFSETNN